jgi:ADP-ribose pyrophosphatase YjhB (NUDIX family)
LEKERIYGMKKIEVVDAIIIKDNKILATCRGYGDFQGMWELPGGKIEQDELTQLDSVSGCRRTLRWLRS